MAPLLVPQQMVPIFSKESLRVASIDANRHLMRLGGYGDKVKSAVLQAVGDYYNRIEATFHPRAADWDFEVLLNLASGKQALRRSGYVLSGVLSLPNSVHIGVAKDAYSIAQSWAPDAQTEVSLDVTPRDSVRKITFNLSNMDANYVAEGITSYSPSVEFNVVFNYLPSLLDLRFLFGKASTGMWLAIGGEKLSKVAFADSVEFASPGIITSMWIGQVRADMFSGPKSRLCIQPAAAVARGWRSQTRTTPLAVSTGSRALCYLQSSMDAIREDCQCGACLERDVVALPVDAVPWPL